MPKHQCFLCASDEGVFLDITDDNKQIYLEQLENCSLEKVPTKDKLPTKICHKCAYELRQCSTFVEKYKRNVKSKHKAGSRANCCNLCLEPQKNETIFDISKDKSSESNFVNKLQKVFNSDRTDYLDKKLICLSCRYIVDVLYDLKIISLETASKLNDVVDKDIDYLTLPKIKTRVVTRKTTTTISYTISVSPDTENESNEMTRTRSQIKVNNNRLKGKSKSRECNKCRSVIEGDDDVHQTSKFRVLCTSCWESNKSPAKETEKQASPSSAETKSCKVYLKDVMMDDTVKKQKLRKTKESDEEKVFVVPDESSEDTNKSRKVAESKKQGKKKQGQKRFTRSTRSEDDELQFLPIKKLRSDAKQAKKGSAPAKSPESSDKNKNLVRAGNRPLTRHKRATGSSLSDADVDNKKGVRKKFKAVLKDVPRKTDAELSDETSSNGEVSSKKRKVTIKTDDTAQRKSPRSKRLQTPFARRTRLAPIITISLSSESEDAELTEADITAYTCEECGSPYENRFLGLKHRLTHYKQLKLELERVVVEKTSKDERQAEGAETNEAMDDIQMTVEDDEDEATEDVSELSTGDRSQENAATADAADKTEEREEMNEDAVEMELVLKETADEKSEEANADGTEEEKESTDAAEREKEDVTDVTEQEKENTDGKEEEKENADATEQEKENVDAKEQEKESTDSKEREKENTDAEELEKENTETVVGKSPIAEGTKTPGKGRNRRRTANRKRKSRAASESASEDALEKQEQEVDTCEQAESNHRDVENKLEDEQAGEECDTGKKKEKEGEEEVEKGTEKEEREIDTEETEKEEEEAEEKEEERVEEMEVSKEKVEEKSTSEEEIKEAVQMEEETTSPKRSPRKVKQSPAKVKQSPAKVKQSPKRVKRSPNKLNESNLDGDKDLEVVLDTSDKVELIESSETVEEIAMEEKDKAKTDDKGASEDAQPEEEESPECAKSKNGEEDETRAEDKDKTDSVDLTEEESSERTEAQTEENDVSESNEAGGSEVVVEEESPKRAKPASEEEVQITQMESRIPDESDRELPKEEDKVIVVRDEPDNNESELNASKQGNANDSNDVAVEVLQEVIDLASEEVQKRLDSVKNNAEQEQAETLEDISREIQNTVDEPSKKSVPL